MYRSSPIRSTLNTSYITGLGMWEVCIEAAHCVALWKRTSAKKPKNTAAVLGPLAYTSISNTPYTYIYHIQCIYIIYIEYLSIIQIATSSNLHTRSQRLPSGWNVTEARSDDWRPVQQIWPMWTGSVGSVLRADWFGFLFIHQNDYFEWKTTYIHMGKHVYYVMCVCVCQYVCVCIYIYK